MATVEYAALAVLVSVVLAVGGAAVDARALPGAVAGQLRRAYCLVANGDCLGPGGPRPCVVSSASRDRETEIELAFLRLRDGRRVVRERLSDGTFRVTVMAANGASAGIRLGARAGARGIDVDAAAGGDVRNEETYVVADEAAADRLVERLEDAALPAGGGVAGAGDFLLDDGRMEDGMVSRTVSVSTRAEAATVAPVGPELAAVGGITTGVRTDHRRRRTLMLRFPREVAVALAAPLDVLEGTAEGELAVELTLDGRRRAESLVLRGRGEAAGGLVEAEARLDLADPVLRDLLGRVAGGDLGAAGALARRVTDGARIDVRRYATTREADAHGGSLSGFGGTKTVVERTARLVSAHGRGPGTGWGPNLECLHAR